MHIAEKYSSLARDAMASGDSVAAENYLQHAEHYNRIIMAAQAQNASMPGMDQPGGMNGGARYNQGGEFSRDLDTDADEDAGEDFMTQQPPRFLERPVYNQNQPQPFIPQNAFPHVQPPLQPAAPAANGAAAYPAENAGPQPDGGGQRRRRRRPIGEHPARSFSPRHGGQPASPVNGSPESEPHSDEAAS